MPIVEEDIVTEEIYDRKYIFAPFAQALTITEGDKFSFTQLLNTTEKSVNKKDTVNMQAFTMEEGDEQGPFTLGLMVTKQLEETASVAAIFGSQVMFTQDINSYTADANLELFSNVWSSLVEHKNSVSIPVKSLQNTSLTVPQGSFVLLSFLTVVIIPVTLLITGIVIWVKRRRR